MTNARSATLLRALLRTFLRSILLSGLLLGFGAPRAEATPASDAAYAEGQTLAGAKRYAEAAVRVLTNTSTGRTGALLAAHLARSGHDVVLLRARSAVAATAGGREETFSTFAELDTALTRLLGREEFDAVIHAAAVSDYGIEAVDTGDGARLPGGAKLESGPAPVLIRLRTQPKLLDTLRARSRNPRLLVVAFKLTVGADAPAVHAAVAALRGRSGADLVVHNDLAERGRGGDFPATIHRPGDAPVVRCATRSELAARLEYLLLSAPTHPQPQPEIPHAALS